MAVRIVHCRETDNMLIARSIWVRNSDTGLFPRVWFTGWSECVISVFPGKINRKILTCCIRLFIYQLIYLFIKTIKQHNTNLINAVFSTRLNNLRKVKISIICATKHFKYNQHRLLFSIYGGKLKVIVFPGLKSLSNLWVNSLACVCRDWDERLPDVNHLKPVEICLF